MHNKSAVDDKNILEQGFTLIELLIVIVIMGILAGIVVFAVGNLASSSKTTACSTEKSTLDTALEAYKAQNGAYPVAVDAPTAMGLLVPNYLKTAPAGYKISFVAPGGVISQSTAIVGPPAVPAGGPNGCT